MQQREPKSLDRLQFKTRKRGRAVEGTGLENRRRGNPFVSSNLTASAKFALSGRNSFGQQRPSRLGTAARSAKRRLFVNESSQPALQKP